MILSNKCGYNSTRAFLRNKSFSSHAECNPYRILGLSRTATRAEIKSAFYELSKKHHPDKNQGCEESAKKFRDIMAAYEILRDEKLKLKCDRELYGTPMSSPSYANSKADYNYEAERNFYERTSKMKSRRQYGRTKYYDFDAWYRAHYVNSNVYKQYSNNNNNNNMFHQRHEHRQSTDINQSFSNGYRIYFLLGFCLFFLYSYKTGLIGK